MFEGPNPAEVYRLRLHRAKSAVLTPIEMLEIRAAQRTFEGAYVRTALGQFSFALVVLKIFTSEFYPFGALFAIFGAGIMVIGLWRRAEGNRSFFTVETAEGEGKNFRTSGNVVVFLTTLSLAAYIALLVLLLRLSN